MPGLGQQPLRSLAVCHCPRVAWSPARNTKGCSKTSNFISKCYHMLIKIEGKIEMFPPPSLAILWNYNDRS